MIFNVGASGGTAKTVMYDNGNAHLDSNNVQGALDELANKIKFATEEPTEVADGTIVMVYEE